MMNLAIVGSTDLTDSQRETARWVVQALILGSMHPTSNNTVISGGADGIDTIAATVAEYNGFKVIEFLPETRNWTGYKKRNRLIAEACDVLWCIRSAQSKTYGSGWTADYAEKLGKTVHRIVLP